MSKLNKLKLSGTTYELQDLSAQPLLSAGTGIQISGNVISCTGGSGTIDTTLDSGSTNAVANSAITAAINAKQDTLVAGSGITISGNVISSTGGGGGNPTVELTQAEYDALVSAGTVSQNTYYIITDAQEIDTTNYWTSAQTQSAITQATSGKQDALVSGTNIKTINNESLLGSGNITIQGGGKAVTGGTNISVTTGETADTINCTLPIASANNNRVMIGYNDERYVTFYITKQHGVSIGFTNYINGQRSVCLGSDNHAEGYCSAAANAVNSAMTNYSFACGNYSKTSNQYEFSCGRYNNSVSASTTFADSGNTLFSVGNGTADNARHNAFEIRQNGDIYITSGGTDIKLQDNLGGVIVDASLDSGSTNAVANSAITTAIDSINTRLAEDEEVTAAALNVLNNNMGGLKLQQITQAAYDALVSGGTVDSSTLYVITSN